MMLLNKKGIMQAVTDIGIALIMILIGILAVNLVSNINSNNQIDNSAREMAKATADNTIALYLKQPIAVGGQQLTMADLVVLAANNKESSENKYEQIWETETANFFSRNILTTEIETLTVSINGYYSKSITLSSSPGISMPLPKQTIRSWTIKLPSYSPNDKQVTLTIEGKKSRKFIFF